MIEIIPSISVLKRQLVRLEQGDFNKAKVYDESPLEVAKRFEDHGITKVHLIDLMGAKRGSMRDLETLELIKSHTSLAVDFGGGINNDSALIQAIESGADKITVGSLAVSKPDLVVSWFISYGSNKITVSADFFNEKIRVKGWQDESAVSLYDHIDYYYQRGIQYVKCSDISRDGLLKGPSFDTYKRILEKFPQIKLIASGGISSIDDIKALADLGVNGVIFGRAYYDGSISLKELETFLAQA